MIAARGLPEYEVVLLEEGPCLQLTLLRAVGWLSRDDLVTRQGAAGPLLPTPGAQMLGSHTFDYAVIPHPEDWRGAAEQARWFARPMRAQWTGSHPGAIPPEASFLRLSPSDLVLSTVKPTHGQGGDIIVRLYNPTEEPISGRVDLALPPRIGPGIGDGREGRGPTSPLEDGSPGAAIGEPPTRSSPSGCGPGSRRPSVATGNHAGTRGTKITKVPCVLFVSSCPGGYVSPHPGARTVGRRAPVLRGISQMGDHLCGIAGGRLDDGDYLSTAQGAGDRRHWLPADAAVRPLVPFPHHGRCWSRCSSPSSWPSPFAPRWTASAGIPLPSCGAPCDEPWRSWFSTWASPWCW